MDNIKNLIVAIKDRDYKITTTAKGVEQLQQTQRNTLKAELVKALFDDLKANYPYTYRVKDGVMLEIENSSIADKITNESGSGAISITIDIKVNDLETNAEHESESYAVEIAEKVAKKEKTEKAKAEKTARDKKERAEKKGE